MKKPFYRSKIGLISFWALLPWFISSHAQDPYTGIWEGNFMEEFKTAILLDQPDESGYTGKIIMFSGESRIQDDELSEINIENRNLSFYIAAKETTFRGSFNEQVTELSGNFIFPDQSEHPLVVKKVQKDTVTFDAGETSTERPIERLIPVEDLKSDLMYLINKLRKYHPRLYSYTSESELNGELEQILTDLKSDLNMEQYYMMIAPLIESIQCSHTGIRLPADHRRSVLETGRFFPLMLYIKDKKAYYLSAPATPGVELQPGCEIMTINHIPVSDLIEQLLSIIPAEGYCMTTKYQELNRDFPYYLHLLDQSDRYNVAFASNTTKGDIVLEAVSYRETWSKGTPPVQPYNFHMIDDPSCGVLKISSFGIMDMDDYFSFLDSTFLLMERSGEHSLIVDLRDNTGGHPIFAAQLFSYLTDKEFTYFKRNPVVTDFEPLYNSMEPNPRHFDGDIYVLVNGLCQSTTGHLISLLKYHTKAFFVGEEPGSTYSCNDFSIQFQLPNTGIEVSIPRTTFITYVDSIQSRLPFSLDYKVNISVKELLSGTDCYLSAARSLMMQNRHISEVKNNEHQALPGRMVQKGASGD